MKKSSGAIDVIQNEERRHLIARSGTPLDGAWYFLMKKDGKIYSFSESALDPYSIRENYSSLVHVRANHGGLMTVFPVKTRKNARGVSSDLNLMNFLTELSCRGMVAGDFVTKRESKAKPTLLVDEHGGNHPVTAETLEEAIRAVNETPR